MNLLDSCISDLQEKSGSKIPESQFIKTWCNVCRNASCENAGIYKTLFQQRISTQEERLFNPIQADPSLDKYARIKDFQDLLHQAYKYEISTKRNDWEPVKEEDVLNYMPSGFQSHTETPTSEPSPSISQPPTTKLNPSVQKALQKPPKGSQNGFVEEDVSGPIQTEQGLPRAAQKPIQTPPPPKDPWSSPEPTKPNKVGSGAKIRLNPDGTIRK